MAGKRSNGEGQILYDKRRKNYRARVTVGWDFDEEAGKCKQIIKSLGTFKTKGEAAKALAEYLKNPYDLANKDITFSELYQVWFDQFLPDHKSFEYRMKASYKYCSAIYNKKFRQITILDMKNVIYNGQTECVKGKYRGQMVGTTPQGKESLKYLFNHMYAYAVEAGIVDRNLAKDFTLDKKVEIQKIKEHKVKIPFTTEEMDILWRSIGFVPFSDMVVFACYSGWRPTELIKLRVEDVHFDEMYIQGGIKTAAGKDRVVPIHPKVLDIVQKYYDEAVEHNSPYLFNDTTKKKGIGLSYDQYLTRFNNILVQLKFRNDITPHYTRHTFITMAKSAGVNEYVLKLIVGHEIGDITEHVYTHRKIEELISEMAKIK